MSARKTFVGPRLRQLRRDRKLTQADMARHLDVSPTYVNLLENNQRSLSVQMLMRLSDAFGVDWRDLVEDDGLTLLSDLRHAFQDPVFGSDRPDLQELRGAVDHCPGVARALLALHRSHHLLGERLLALAEGGAADIDGLRPTNPEGVVHDLFRRNRNHFDVLERAAERLRAEEDPATDEIYSVLKARLKRRLGIVVRVVPAADLPHSLRVYDEAGGVVSLSEVLDYPNRVFQIAHVLGLLEQRAAIDTLARQAETEDSRILARCRVELANYFAAAVMMPYDAFVAEADAGRFDIDHLAARFGVSYEQACHRLTTLQREGRQSIPFFFLRIDKAGNVIKRFNATSFHLAEYGGACPRWDIHLSFRSPGQILPQFVEMPDGSRYFTINRTVDRPSVGHRSTDQRLAVTLGCAIDHATRTVYAATYQIDDPNLFEPIGINCRLCQRQGCSQRAHQPLHLALPIDENRRGETRFES